MVCIAISLRLSIGDVATDVGDSNGSCYMDGSVESETGCSGYVPTLVSEAEGSGYVEVGVVGDCELASNSHNQGSGYGYDGADDAGGGTLILDCLVVDTISIGIEGLASDCDDVVSGVDFSIDVQDVLPDGELLSVGLLVLIASVCEGCG